MSNDAAQTINKYKLVNCLVSGQHSQIWEVVDNETTRRVAMKLLLPEAIQEVEQLTFLKNEFKVGRSFEHPNILKYYEFYSRRKTAYFTMDLFGAPNLKTWFHNDLRGVHIRFKRLVELVAMALEHIHERGYVHRDLKPENILMSKSSEVRLIDFSLTCRAAGALSKMLARKQAVIKGTRTYMAPEQILGKPLTPQTDIYSLGVTLYELLTGQAPFAGSTPNELLIRHINEKPPEPSSVNPNLTPQIDLILMRMLAKKPADRHKKVSEVLIEFRNVSVFKEEVTETAAPTEREQAEEALKKVLGGALDSRADALRTKLGVAAPATTAKGPKPKIGQRVQSPRPAPPPTAPGPMPMPMPMQPVPMMPPPQMPMAPYPMAPMPGYGMPGAPMPGVMMPGGPMPGGPSPWVSVPAAGMPQPGMPAPAMPGPWMPQPAPIAPHPPAPGQVPAIPPAPQGAPRPAPPPVAPTAVPQVAPQPAPPQRAPPTAPPQPAARAPVPQPPPKKPPAPVKPGEGMKIDDLLGFDDLPPV